MSETPGREQEIRARAEAAEDGWNLVPDEDDVYRFEIRGDGPTHVAVFGGDPDDGFASYLTRENAEFAANARQDIPWLLDKNARLREQLSMAKDRNAHGFREMSELRGREASAHDDLAAAVGRASSLTWPELIRHATELRADRDAATPAAVPAPDREQRLNRYAAAFYEYANRGYRWADAHPDDVITYRDDAAAVLPVADTELQEARDEIARLRTELRRNEAYTAGAVHHAATAAVRRALEDAIKTVEDPDQRRGLGWESARDVLRLMLTAVASPARERPCHCGLGTVQQCETEPWGCARECTASNTGNCLAESQSESACDTAAGECVHDGTPAREQGEAQPDTFPAWLYERFGRITVHWGDLPENYQSYWAHEASAVRRAVSRNGFKSPEGGDAR